MAAKRRVVKKLLDEGSKVKLTVMFRGREITHQDLGVELLRKTAEAFKDEAKLEKAPTMEGRRLSIVIAPIGQQRAGAKVEKEQDAKGRREQEAVANA